MREKIFTKPGFHFYISRDGILYVIYIYFIENFHSKYGILN